MRERAPVGMNGHDAAPDEVEAAPPAMDGIAIARDFHDRGEDHLGGPALGGAGIEPATPGL
jgi:hypothetical protein